MSSRWEPNFTASGRRVSESGIAAGQNAVAPRRHLGEDVEPKSNAYVSRSAISNSGYREGGRLGSAGGFVDGYVEAAIETLASLGLTSAAGSSSSYGGGVYDSSEQGFAAGEEGMSGRPRRGRRGGAGRFNGDAISVS